MPLPPKYWPINLWIAAAAAVLLLVHAVGLAIQLALVQARGGVPENLHAPDSGPVAPIVESYGTQIIVGFVPGLVVFGVGIWAAVFSVRRDEESIARWGRILLGVLALLAVALIVLALPWLL